jgi:hypothetical protein
MITDDEGYPIVKVHGFGVTSTPLMARYPWYSVDSISWKLISGMGGILIPRCDPISNSYDYSLSPHVVTFSERESKSKGKAKHYLTKDDLSLNYIDKYYKEREYAKKELTIDYTARRSICALFFQEVTGNNNIGGYQESIGFFKQPKMKKKAIEFDGKISCYFGIDTITEMGQLCRSILSPPILFSYNYIPKSIPDDYFKKYKEAAEIKEKISE